MFHKLQIRNMTWLQLEKTFQSKDFFFFFFALIHDTNTLDNAVLT